MGRKTQISRCRGQGAREGREDSHARELVVEKLAEAPDAVKTLVERAGRHVVE